jgi:hypothetical protein
VNTAVPRLSLDGDARSIGFTLREPCYADALRHDRTEQSIKRLVGSRGKPDYDSIVVAGNGIGALTFAARLARDPCFSGRVTIVAPPISENRRLINGVSMRGLAADYICAAVGCSQAELLGKIAIPESGQPLTFRQTAAMYKPEAKGWSHSQVGTWQSFAPGRERPVVIGARNSRVTAAITELMAPLGVEFVFEQARDATHLRSFARGDKPLIVNATTNGTLLGADSQPPERMVFAAQVAFQTKTSGVAYPLEPFTTHTALVRRDGIINVGYYSPFSDPLSPHAAWYGIFARVVEARDKWDKLQQLAQLNHELFEIGDTLGLTPDDPDETYAGALVPAAGFGAVRPSSAGTLELKRAYSGGAPCFLADGILSAAMGGVLAAEAVIHGQSPDHLVRTALAKLRWYNRLWWIETTKMASFSDLMVRTLPKLAMAYPHKASLPTWASHA